MKGRGKVIFPLLQFLVTRMGPTGTPHSLRILQTASWENWQKPGKRVRILTKVSSPKSVEPGGERKGKFHVVPSFPNSHWLENTLVIDTFPPRESYCLLVCLILCPENLPGQLSGWGPQTYSQTEIPTVASCQRK